MKLSEMVRDPVITSRFGDVREFSKVPHTGIDVVSKTGDRFLRAPLRRGQGVWMWNTTSCDRSAARRIYDIHGSEFPIGWYYADRYGLIFTWFDQATDLSFAMAHLEPMQSSDIASHHGIHLWEHRRRYQKAYDVWHDVSGNMDTPMNLQGGELVGVYSDVGNSIGAHVHIECRKMELGTDTAAEWKLLDPCDFLEV